MTPRYKVGDKFYYNKNKDNPYVIQEVLAAGYWAVALRFTESNGLHIYCRDLDEERKHKIITPLEELL